MKRSNGDLPKTKVGRKRLIVVSRPAREALQRMLRHPVGLGNPFPRGTHWHRVWGTLLEGLAKLQQDGDAKGFAGLPLDRQRLLWTQAVVHVARLLDTAEMVSDAAARERNMTRVLAWLNSDIRLSQMLGVSPRPEEDAFS